MRNIHKTTNGFGNPIFKISADGNVCKMIFDCEGNIVKAFCGTTSNLVLVYSKDDANEHCLEDAMYDMLSISQQCFFEMVKEIKSEHQLSCAKNVMVQRCDDLRMSAEQALEKASEIDSWLRTML